MGALPEAGAGAERAVQAFDDLGGSIAYEKPTVEGGSVRSFGGVRQ